MLNNLEKDDLKAAKERLVIAREIDHSEELRAELDFICDKEFSLEELNAFLEKKENITPVVEKIFYLENKGYLTREDSYKIFFKRYVLDGGVEYDDSNDNVNTINKNENFLLIVDYLKNNKSKDEFISFIKKAINPQISKDFEDWKKFLIENKYINKQEEIIYKPQ